MTRALLTPSATRDLREGLSPQALTLHPYCNACGWRKGGIDSWDGRYCKCGHYEPAFETLLRAPEQQQ